MKRIHRAQHHTLSWRGCFDHDGWRNTKPLRQFAVNGYPKTNRPGGASAANDRRPLRSWDLILQYISETRTGTGLTVRAVLVTEKYETGITVSDEVLDGLILEYHTVCPQWN